MSRFIPILCGGVVAGLMYRYDIAPIFGLWNGPSGVEFAEHILNSNHQDISFFLQVSTSVTLVMVAVKLLRFGRLLETSVVILFPAGSVAVKFFASAIEMNADFGLTVNIVFWFGFFPMIAAASAGVIAQRFIEWTLDRRPAR